MSDSFRQFGRRVITGEARGLGPAMFRAALAAAEPVYALAMRGRNWTFDRGRGVRRLPRPVISVGNLTTGGTGKTPVVRWLCEQLRAAGRRPAVLMRGYGAKSVSSSDEQAMLDSLLNAAAQDAKVMVHANPDRHAGGAVVLAAHPDVDVFVMDDGFQHRRLARDFDLVLIDACEPFGHGHVLPRGLLREPLPGLRRADAILITRADQGDADAAARTVRRFNPAAPVYRCAHAHVGLRAADGSSAPLDMLDGRAFFAFAGIGNPEGLGRQLQSLPGRRVGHHWFVDHRDYSARDLDDVSTQAQRAGAELLITTEKDWVKIRPLITDAAARAQARVSPVKLPILRLELSLKFADGDDANLLQQIQSRIARR